MGSWGTGGWGTSGWGVAGLGEGLELVDAQPIRENVVRLFFNQAVHFSGVLDPGDASDVKRYGVTPVEGTIGEDGEPARSVLPALVSRPREDGAAGRLIDLWVDRHFAPYPARYLVSVNQLRSSTGELLTPGKTSFEFDGLAAPRTIRTRDTAISRGDIANPQVSQALGDSVPVGADALLGSYPVDERGDYATDRGVASYKKRIIRRLTSRKAGFKHLIGYGVGIPERVKQLDRPGLRERLAAEAEQQIKLEPETQSTTVTVVNVPGHPEVAWFRVRAKMRDGTQVGMDVPFATGG